MPPLNSREPMPQGENTWGLFWGGQGNGGWGEDEQLRGSSFPLNGWGFGSSFCQGCLSLDNWCGEIPAQLLERTPKGSPLGICGYFIYPWDKYYRHPQAPWAAHQGLPKDYSMGPSLGCSSAPLLFFVFLFLSVSYGRKWPWDHICSCSYSKQLCDGLHTPLPGGGRQKQWERRAVFS